MYIFIIALMLFSNSALQSYRSCRGTTEYFLALVIYLFSAMYLLFFKDIFTLYIAFELQNFCIYSIISISSRKISLYSVKYFFLSSFLSFILLFYLYFFYYYTGSLQFHLITELDGHINSILLVLFFFKFGIFPFTFWLLEFYKSFSGSSLTFLVAISKIPLFYIFLQFSPFILFNYIIILYLTLSFIYTTLSMLYSTTNSSKFFAYSSSNTMNFLLLYSFMSPDMSFYPLTYFLYYIVSLTFIFNFVNLKHTQNGKIVTILFYMSFGLPFSFQFFAKLYMLFIVFSFGTFINSMIFLFVYWLGSIPYFIYIFNYKTVRAVNFTVNNSLKLNLLLLFIILSIFLQYLIFIF